MISRIKPEHKPPVEFFRRIAGTCRSERPPHIRNRRDDTIMNMGRGRCGIASFVEGGTHSEYDRIDIKSI